MIYPFTVPRRLLIATTNPGKAREISALLGDLPIDRVHLGDAPLPQMPKAAEDGDTFEQNAVGKALHYGKLSGLPTIAEDAGLQIPILDGWPGVRSSRIAQTDEARVAMVLDRLKGKADEDWLGLFISVAAFYDPRNEITETFLGVCQGTIVEEPKGENGFGYDPIFWHPGYGRTMAELTTEEKNLVSHRGQSFRALARWLREYDWE